MSDPSTFLLFASIVQPLVDVADSILNFFHDDVGFAWGTAIVALTVVIRTLLIPLTYKQIKGMRAMQALQPQVKEIQEKYKNDRQRQQQEMMRFWQENKINPLSSCLPLLLQLPVFFALFELLRSDTFKQEVLSSGGASWLFVDSVVKDPTGVELVLLIVLFMGSMALSSLVMIRSSPSGAGSQQFLLLGVFSVVGAVFVPTFPAGLSIYWITTNFWTVGQQWVAAKVLPAPHVEAPEEKEAAKPPPPPPRKRKKRR